MTTLSTLLYLWESEGFKLEKLKQETDPEDSRFVWILYRVYSNTFYYDYGRHAVMRVLIRWDTQELIGHELFNVSERNGQNPQNFSCIGDRNFKGLLK